MKKLFGIATICILASTIAFANKNFNFAQHADIVTALSYINSSATSAKGDISGWKDESKKSTAKELYGDVKAKSDALISRYSSIIRNPRQSRKSNVTVTKEISELQSSYNKYIEFYKNNLPPAAHSVITAEVIKMVIDAGKSIYDIVDKIGKDKREARVKEVTDLKMEAWK